MPLATLEALLDDVSDARVRGLWAALDAAGLPSQAQHRGQSNAPHLTLVSAPVVDPATRARASELLRPIVPRELPVSGYVVFDAAPRQTLALLCVAPPALHDAVAELGRLLGDTRRWVPHLTLARRVTPAQLERALEVPGEHGIPHGVTLAGVRHWDPTTRSVATVV